MDVCLDGEQEWFRVDYEFASEEIARARPSNSRARELLSSQCADIPVIGPDGGIAAAPAAATKPAATGIQHASSTSSSGSTSSASSAPSSYMTASGSSGWGQGKERNTNLERMDTGDTGWTGSYRA